LNTKYVPKISMKVINPSVELVLHPNASELYMVCFRSSANKGLS